MILFHAVQLAANLFIKKAYPSGPPPKILEKTEALNKINSNNHLLGWDALECENNRYSLRLGNEKYPHMKLVFMVKGDCNLFYVDAHDAHFTINKEVLGYEGLLTLREANTKYKKAIEATWLSENLPVFGAKVAIANAKARNGCLEVLALDDEPQILDMLCMCGASIGLKLHCATTVRQAIQSIEDQPPDVVLCDIMIPEESGYVLVAWMQEHRPEVPIFYMTGLNIEKVDKTGVKGVLQKPFTVNDLSDALKEVKQRKPSG